MVPGTARHCADGVYTFSTVCRCVAAPRAPGPSTFSAVASLPCFVAHDARASSAEKDTVTSDAGYCSGWVLGLEQVRMFVTRSANVLLVAVALVTSDYTWICMTSSPKIMGGT